MPIRGLTEKEESNRQLLAQYVGELALLMPTATGLKKSIMDATTSVRSFLKEAGIHDYAGQEQGEAGKVIVPAELWTEDKPSLSQASLYRPFAKGKEGDPRIWITRLGSFTDADEMLALFAFDKKICVVNLSRVDIAQSTTKGGELHKLLETVRQAREAVSSELLKLLANISSVGPLKAVCEGDTAVGRTLEAALGILQNPSKQPDFKGIELKSFRSKLKGTQNRATLFAQVPNWSESLVKGTKDFLDRFGYERRGTIRLNCTVSAANTNSQGLRFRVDQDEDRLIEFHAPTKTDCVFWSLPTLHGRLLSKHKETFWIKVRSEREEGTEYFHLMSVIHTEKPSIVQFDSLLAGGGVTMDHVSKILRNGAAKDQGYLFKLRKQDLPVLFAKPREYDLTAR